MLSLIAIGILLAFLAIRARRNPLLLAGAAAFLVLGRAIYIDITPWRTVFYLPSLAVTTGDIVFAAVALGWLYARARRPRPCARLAVAWTGLGILMVSFVTLEVALAAASVGGLPHPTILLTIRDWFYIPFGFLMTLDVFRRFTNEETAQYLGVLSVFVACASVLYIASALNLPVYPFQKYLSVSYGGTTVIRDFATLPFWAGLAWCHYLSKPKRSTRTYVAMAVIALAVLFTYTRLQLVLLVLTTLLGVVFLVSRRGQRTRGATLGFAAALLAVGVLAVGPVAAPAQFGYFRGRLASIVRSGGVSQEPNAQERLRSFSAARAAGAGVDSYFGAGLPAPPGTQFGEVYINSDSDWIGIVYHTGLAGLLVFGAPLVFALWCGARGLMKKRGVTPASELLLTGMLATVWFGVWRFDSAVYLWWPAVSLLPVVLVARAGATPTAARVADDV